MLFNSVIFITVFLPLALLGWFLLQKLENPAWAKAFLIGMSFWFYGYYNVSYLWILLVSLAGNYAFSFLLRRIRGGGFRRGLFVCGVLGNLGLLFYFKYFNFFIDNCNFLLHTDIRLEKIALPLGISFFTFQQMSFLIERYRGNAPHYPLLDYVFFVSFFPQLIAGPIVLHSELVPQLQGRQNRRFSPEGFYDGATLFILGLAKKVLLADSLAMLVNAEYDNIAMLDTPTAWIVIVWYMMELYFDFSGYCDMARGIAAMFGFRLPENFDSPFKAASVREFWRRWHMTLSRFLSQYVYLPLGGNRKGKRRQILNLLAVFLVSGLWHGANWSFVVWGGLNGAYQVAGEVLRPLREGLCRLLRIRREGAVWRWVRRAFTFCLVDFSWLFFRASTFSQARAMLARVAGDFRPAGLAGGALFELGLDRPNVWLALAAVGVLAAADLLQERWGPLRPRLTRQVLPVRWAVYLAGVLAVLVFGIYGPGYDARAFTYFQF